ncbi:MAG: DNA polymerase III subunit alpha [Candidatus Pacebacteria bacterium]|nr:DNA polymerase III subunit alpha [Candidatus Paceibacterota bacterium]
MNSKFTHLHVHSHYSLLDGLPKIDDLLNYVKELGMDSVAITDHGVLYGAVEFYKKAKSAGIKPIIGAELYTAPNGMLNKRPNIDDKRHHLILLVKNEIGYKNLVKLITKAHLEGFYYKPRVDDELLAKHSNGLIALSACIQGKIPKAIIKNRLDEAKNIAQKYQQIFGQENFYLEIQEHPNIKEQDKANQGLIKLSKELGIPLVITNDCHYLRKEDKEAQDVLMQINTGAKSDDPERLTMINEDFSMKSPEQMINFCASLNVNEAIHNTQKIVEQCNFEFSLGKTKLPVFPTPNNETPEEYLKNLAYLGLEKKKDQFPKMEEARARLDYELSVVNQTGFAGYFLIVQDFVNWAKNNRIVVGPGRGSAGGSLIAYLLNITEVNPLQYGLLFERFLNPERISMPDIDLDFTDRRRDEVINYVAEKYGHGKVAQIITFGTMAARAVIRDVGRATNLPYAYCDQIAKMIPFGFTLKDCMEKIAEFRQLYDTDPKARELIDFAKKLEGVARHASTHACGVVISKDPLDEIVPLQFPTQSDQTIVTQYEMHAIDDLGLLKMDFLGLKNLTILEDALARIYKVKGESLDLASIPFDDAKTFKIFQKAQTTSIFQLESSGMKRYLKELKPTCLEDVVSMVALYRPGPMQFIPDYIDKKAGKKPIEYMHPKLKPILEKTYGICIYQEQLMQIARDVAGFTLPEADTLRKAIGKKIPELLRAQKDKFIEGVAKNGSTKAIGERLWEWILPFAQYGFNKSHSVAYAIIAYHTAYLKAHFPVEFMAAVLTSEKSDVERIAFLIDECKAMGIEVLQPDVNESFRNFSVVPNQKQIRFGLLAIKNVGENIVDTILTERKNNGPFASFADFVSRIDTKDFNKKSMEALIKTGAFDKFEERGRLLNNLEDILAFNREIRKNKANSQTSLFSTMTAAPPSFQLKQYPEASNEQKLLWEKELLGLYISSHPLENIKNILQKKTLPLKDLKDQFPRQKIKIGGIISNIKKILTKNGQHMLFVKVEDLTDKAEVVVFPATLEKYSSSLQENKIVFVTGRVDFRDNVPKLICEEIEEILEA